MNNISDALERLFLKHRIIFWYDEKEEMRAEYEALSLPDVEKIELKNNEFGVKYRISRAEAKQKFLLYHEGAQPADLDNWLLDIQLAQVIFNADQVSMWLAELDLGPEFYKLVEEHREFFNAESRRKKLKAKIQRDDSHRDLQIKMLAICAASDPEARLEGILASLLNELAEERKAKIDLIRRTKLDSFLWKELETRFGYQSDTPGVADFVIALFKAGYALGLGKNAELSQDAPVFLKHWQNNRRFARFFEKLSAECSVNLDIEHDLQKREMQSLLEIDYFQLIEQKILKDLIQGILQRTLSAGEVANIIWRRHTSYWYASYTHIYEALKYGSQFIAKLAQSDLQMDSLADGIRKYQQSWYKLDQNYRKFIYHCRASQQTTLLGELNEQIEKLYSNNYLLPLNDHWQGIIDSQPLWDATPISRQNRFFEEKVSGYIHEGTKVAVIISDALRFEIGQELSEFIEEKEGYTAEIETMLSLLPSYTQLGMAALLPNQELRILENGNVEVDGQLSVGLENRAKILAKGVDKGATALRATDLLAMNRDQYREATKGYQVLYIYHNQIDHAGDDKISEGSVFDVVEKTFKEIRTLLKKLYDSYFVHILITADHGFIYQNQEIDESEFASLEVKGDEIQKHNRRFVIGKNLIENPSVKKYSAKELGLLGDYEIAIPKSINRLRVRGAGSRYVHGGASLEEVVLPLITVRKKRAKDVSIVDVDIITSSSSNITTGQLSVAFYQTKPVSAKLHPRKLRAAIYTKEGVQISDMHELNFDLSAENPREREVKIRFILSKKAEQANNQTVYLKLEEPITNTSHYREYRSMPYQLRRSFTSDFDF